MVKIGHLLGIMPVGMMSIWLIRLIRSVHLSRHRMLSMLLAAFLVHFAVSVSLLQVYKPWSPEYGYFWLSNDAIQWGLWVAVLAETATLVVSRYRGFVRLGGLILRTGFTVSALFLLFLWTIVPSHWIDELNNFWTFERYVVYGSLSLLAIVFSLFAAYFRLIPDHNTAVIYGVSTIILVSNVTTAAVLQRGNLSMFYTDVAIHFICFGAGAWLFEPAQELSPARENHAIAADLTPATRQLESMNDVLVRLLS